MSKEKCRHPDCVIKLRNNGIDGYCTIHAAEMYDLVLTVIKGEIEGGERYRVFPDPEAPTQKTVPFDFVYRWLDERIAETDSGLQAGYQYTKNWLKDVQEKASVVLADQPIHKHDDVTNGPDCDDVGY